MSNSYSSHLDHSAKRMRISNDKRLGSITGKYQGPELEHTMWGMRYPHKLLSTPGIQIWFWVVRKWSGDYTERHLFTWRMYTIKLNLITDPLSLRVYGAKIWTLLHVHFRFDFNFWKNPLFAREFWASAYRATCQWGNSEATISETCPAPLLVVTRGRNQPLINDMIASLWTCPWIITKPPTIYTILLFDALICGVSSDCEESWTRVWILQLRGICWVGEDG